MAIVLEARGLTKTYATLPAVDDVSFTIRSGEVLGYLGPNGAGKSTTVKMLVGLLQPTSGQVLLNGEPIARDLTAYKRRIGYVPETADLYPFLSGWEYLDLVATLRGMARKRFEPKASNLLELLSMHPHRHALIASYSKGMRQRIALIGALLHDPDVLILDEPLSGLDATAAVIVRKSIELLAADGRAVFFSTPVLEIVEKLCSHIVMLKRGKVVVCGSVEEIARSRGWAGLEEAFLQLTEQTDAAIVAKDIAAAVRAPAF